MASSGMLRRVAPVRTNVSEEHSSSFIGVTRIGELGTTLAVTSNFVFLRSMRWLLVTASLVPSSPILVTLMKEALSFSETSVLKGLHGVRSQKTPFFIATAVKTPKSYISSGKYSIICKVKYFLQYSVQYYCHSTCHLRV
jgi:hypothetical protein